MNTKNTYTAFVGNTHLITDSLLNVALAVKNQQHDSAPILIFEDQTGKQIDVNITGSESDIQQRYAEAETVKKVGRPKLGVISREITLQQKHWDWLDLQNSSASAVIRKLIDQELNNAQSESNIMMTKQATDRFMSAMLGNMPNYEEATRALYQGNKESFIKLIQNYPKDLREYLVSRTSNVF